MTHTDSRFNPSRRDLMTLIAGAGGAALLSPRQLLADDIDPRITEVVSKTILVDMHNHVFSPSTQNPAEARPDLDLFGAMKQSGLTAICQTYNVDGLRDAKPGDYYKYHLQTLDVQDRLLATNKMRRAISFKDLQDAHKQGQPIIIQDAEGAQFLDGHLERIEEAYKRGLRLLQLVHFRDDMTTPLGDVQSANPGHLGGLTPFGAQVVKECNRLGIVVDMAHGAYETVFGALKVATQPLLITHTAMNSPVGRGTTSDSLSARLLSKEHARAVADAGGVVGVWHLFKTMKEYVAAIRDMVDVIGVDHVGIGTDTGMTGGGTNKIWPDQNGGFFYAFGGEMLKQGFKPDEIAKIGGGNFCRVFEKCMRG